MEKVKEEKVVKGEIEMYYFGYFGSQDIYYVGMIKGVGCIYQQIYIDIYCKVVQVKFYVNKDVIIVVDLFNDCVLFMYE